VLAIPDNSTAGAVRDFLHSLRRHDPRLALARMLRPLRALGAAFAAAASARAPASLPEATNPLP